MRQTADKSDDDTVSADGARLRDVLGQRPFVDLRSLGLIILMVAGLPIVGALFQAALIPAWVTLLAGSLLMNLSFTAWHEPAHQLFSRSKTLNAAAGWIAALASVHPGYFARRREHLIHHRWEGDPDRDPVHPRIQTGFLGFLPNLVRLAMARKGAPDDFPPLTNAQRMADAVSNALALGICVASVAWGFWEAVLLAWLGPRLIVFVAHAYLICFLPHHVPGGGYTKHRIFPSSPFLAFFTLNQHLHGIHHYRPWIPWHRYDLALQRFPESATSETFDRPPSLLRPFARERDNA